MQRYDLKWNGGQVSMIPVEGGRWAAFEEAADQIAALKASLEGRKGEAMIPSIENRAWHTMLQAKGPADALEQVIAFILKQADQIAALKAERDDHQHCNCR